MHGRIRSAWPCLGLRDQPGVGDLAAHDRHHVGAARSQNTLGVVRRRNTRLALHARMAHDCFQSRGMGFAGRDLLERGRDNVGAAPVAAGTDGDVVYERALIMPDDSLFEIVDGLYRAPPWGRSRRQDRR